MPLKSTSLQRFGSLMLVVVMALLLVAVVLGRGCSDTQMMPSGIAQPAPDSATVGESPDSSRSSRAPKRHRPATRKPKPPKHPAIPSGSPLDHKI